MAMHFAVRNKKYDHENGRVYVLEVYRLNQQLTLLPDMEAMKNAWKAFAAKYPSRDFDEDSWEDSYLPTSKELLKEIPVPPKPLILDFPHITRRIAAQRSRFIVLGTEPNWISDEFKKPDSTIKLIIVPPESRAKIRQELRECGITESVIYPDLDGLGREMKQLWEDRRADF
jgi:hypothetical protein